MSLPKLQFDPAPPRPQLRAVRAPLGPVTVLKFGSSILKDAADVPDAVSEIYRHVRRGEKVVAVVSALSGHTDQLLAQARLLGAAHDNGHLPRYVALGEEKAASLLAIGCDRVGLDCQSLSVRELGILADGSPEDAAPVRLGSEALFDALQRHEVVVVPGFGAVNARGRVVLLGRGGSDLTAVFLAAELGLDRVRLLKDVDGVYEADPAKAEVARRYDRLDWATAAEVGGKLVQRRAVETAQARGVEIEVAALGREDCSVIGEANAPAVPVVRLRKRRVAVAGCGVVGGGVLQRLLARPDAYEVVCVLVRDLKKARDVELDAGLLTDDAEKLLASGADVLIEALSEGPPAEQLIRKALAKGLDVVSANKQALAADLPGLKAAAEEHDARLAYSAAVGGAVPMIETLKRARAAGKVASFEGVMNGTVNFMLDRLDHGASFDQALDAAKRAGFAEEDSSSDLEGRDAAAKLRLLAYEAFGAIVATKDVPLETLGPSGHRRGVKQLARCRREGDRLVSSVFLEPASDPLFDDLDGERNALKVVLEDGRVFACRGRGAGRWPTTESVLADLGELDAASLRI